MIPILKRVPKESKLVFIIFCSYLFIHTAFRIAFLLYYHSAFAALSWQDWIPAFFYGLRFDLAFSSMFTALILIFLHLPYLRRWMAYRKGILFIALFLFIWTFVISSADLQYFGHAGKRLGYEIWAYFNQDIFPILKTAILTDTWLIIFLLFLLLVIAGGYFILLKKMGVLDPPQITLKSGLIGFFAWALLFVLLIRGGVQRIPLRVADSFISPHRMVNLLAINSPYITIRMLSHKKQSRVMDKVEAQEVMLKLMGISKNQIKHPQYPLELTLANTKKPTPYNVVLILMESWSAKYMGALGNSLKVTPEFDRLASEGVLFNRFYANGFRTTSGLFSSLMGMPDQVGMPTMRRQSLSSRYASISRILKQHNYTNVFLHGGPLDFDNLKNMLVSQHFDVIIGKKDMHDCGGPLRTWGYDDEFLFQRAHRELEKLTPPFFSYILSVSSHAPYLLPQEKPYWQGDPKHPEFAFLNSLHYSDQALGQFFRLAKKSAYFKNTIFLITADHTHHHSLNQIQNQHVPLLIYAPFLLPPAENSKIGSHLDIPATVYALLGLSRQATLGHDLFDRDKAGFAYFIGGQSMGFIMGDQIATMNARSTHNNLFKILGNGNSLEPIQSDIEKKRMSRYTRAFYQFSDDLMNENRILQVGRMKNHMKLR